MRKIGMPLNTPVSKQAWNRAIAVSVAGIVLSACNPIEGTLSVNKPVPVNTVRTEATSPFCAFEGGFDCEERVIQESMRLRPGKFKAALNFDDPRSVTLTLRSGDQPGDIRFDVPHGMHIPRDQGRFRLSGRDIGQPLSLEGEVRTNSQLSSLRREVQSCSYVVERWTCPGGLFKSNWRSSPSGQWLLGHWSAGRWQSSRGQLTHKKPHCGYHSYRIQGTQPVEFQYETITRSVELYLRTSAAPRADTDTTNGDADARFSGTQQTRHKIVQYRGECF